MKPVLAVIVAATVAFGPNARSAAARPAEGSVTSLSIVPASGKAEVVIGVDGGLEVRDFTLRSPDRIVLDLSGASLGKLGARSYDRIARGGITDVRYSNFRKGTVRVVLYLDAPHTYQISKADGEVRIAVTVPIGAKFAAWHAGAGAMPEAQVATTDAESRTVTLADTRSPVVEPAGEPAPAATDRVIARLVADNADARTTRTARESEVHPGRGNAESRTQPAPPQQRSQQPRITVTYQGSDIRDVLAAFAAFSGRTIIPSQNVGSLKVDAEIRDQPWDVALQAILASQGLAASEDANGIIIVDTQDRIAARSATEPLTTRLVRLNYQRATSVADQIRQRIMLCIPSSSDRSGSSSQAAGQPPVAGAPPAQQSAPVTPGTNGASNNGPCVGRGSVSADENTNTVSITAPVSNIAELVG
ncbi:MAG: AMIN domain-containing protein, partial [Gemmatimonadaceae bacterium]